MKKVVCLLILALVCTFCLTPISDASAMGGYEVATYVLAGSTIVAVAALAGAAATIIYFGNGIHKALGSHL